MCKIAFMYIRKILRCFFVVISLATYGFYGSAVAGYNNLQSIERSSSFNIQAGNAGKVEEYVAMKICRGIERAKTTKKIVALTFDDGPHQKYTKEILEILKQNNIRATFFVIGKNAQRYPDIITAAYKNGNIIGNHSYSHFYLTNLTDDEIKFELSRTSQLVHTIIKEYPILFRPPYGACSYRSARITQQLDFVTIVWNDMTNDYDVKQTTHEKIAADIIKNAKPGSIIGLHDGGGNREKTVAALPIIINALKIAGYEFLTLPELLDIQAYR